MKPIPLAKPIIGRTEIREVKKVLKSGNLAQGPYVRKFEEDFSAHMEGRPCVAVNSGTSALHLALLSLGIGPGDEVIVPSFTFAASANSIALTGAVPVFVDINLETFNLSVAEVEKLISKKTKAIMVVHLFGLPASINQICKIAEKYGLLVIEDAAQAHLANIQMKNVGTFSDAAVFSFYPTKNMTTGEGGMIVFSNNQAERMARLYRNQGMETRYQNEVVGFNLRMTEIQAAIGIHQLKTLPAWTEKRKENAEILSKNISSPIVVLPTAPTGYSHVYHQYTVRILKNRDLVSQTLSDEGIGNAVYYPTQVHKLPSFASTLELPNTEQATKEVLSLPIHPSLKKSDLKRISSSVNRIAEQYES